MPLQLDEDRRRVRGKKKGQFSSKKLIHAGERRATSKVCFCEISVLLFCGLVYDVKRIFRVQNVTLVITKTIENLCAGHCVRISSRCV